MNNVAILKEYIQTSYKWITSSHTPRNDTLELSLRAKHSKAKQSLHYRTQNNIQQLNQKIITIVTANL